MILSPINARGSRSAPIVYRSKAKSVFGQQQTIAENSCLQPDQTVSDVPVGNSTLQPVQNVSARPVVSSDLQSDPVVSSEMQSDPIVSSELQSERTASISTGQTARSVSDHAISDATSDATSDVLSQNQTISFCSGFSSHLCFSFLFTSHHYYTFYCKALITSAILSKKPVPQRSQSRDPIISPHINKLTISQNPIKLLPNNIPSLRDCTS
ncbi:hypothetical protein V6N11_035215 [Hibiscus sabdariffa]|uniref:Uncharacterized protein n=1 Tax=Hibiscus sabdariffa TaxID=183260 RepID=A0ABR2R052_9ROSI